MNSTRTRVMMEISLSVALAYVLRRFAVWQMPFGGDISLAMLPLVVVALRRGVGAGVLAGVLFGLLDYTIEPYFVHWAQFFLDYPVAYGLVGVAGIMQPLLARFLASRARAAQVAVVAAGALAGGVARFAAHFLSGLIFFAANAPAGQPAWLYSVIYNATYVFPSVAICAVAAAVLVPLLQVASPVGGSRA
jgi:thiamine transporter